MPTIENPTITTFHLRPCDADAKQRARDEAHARGAKPLCRKTLSPQGSVQVTEKELDALLEEKAWQERLEKVGDGKYRVHEHVGVAGDFDRRIRAYRREKAKKEAEQRKATEDLETIKRRLEAVESQAAAEKKGDQVSSKDTSGDGGEPKSGGKGGGGAKKS